MTEPRLKIAVFIDFDNIEIGIKNTLSTQFEPGLVLDALKERGEVISKTAYADWKRAEEYSRSLTQHAIKLVQRNLTPGGDKNGADINLALDALELAFTHPHINAFAIVGGDSDFITLVEKLKQYDKKVFVIGGRAFTSMVMQRNCNEFIAYENLMPSRSQPRRPTDRGGRPAAPAQAPVVEAFPLVKRALEILSEREVTPQLGLLKSTLLQLDSTFSERTYGVGSFRDFADKLAAAGLVTLKQSGRSVHVELRDGAARIETEAADGAPEAAAARSEAASAVRADYAGPVRLEHPGPVRVERAGPVRPEPVEGQTADAGSESVQPEPTDASSAAAAEPARSADAVAIVRRVLQAQPRRWPMYVRNVRQIVRGAEPGFDERKYGFGNIIDLARACQREGLFRLERDRQGVLRVFAGPVLQPPKPEEVRMGDAAPIAVVEATPVDEPVEQVIVEEEAPAVPATFELVSDAIAEQPEAPAPEAATTGKRPRRKRSAAAAGASRKRAATPKTPRTRARKTAAVKEPAIS